jgi:hypothetical protein
MCDSPDLTTRFHILGPQVGSFVSYPPVGSLQRKEVGVGAWSLSMQNLEWLCPVANSYGRQTENQKKFRANGMLLFTF